MNFGFLSNLGSSVVASAGSKLGGLASFLGNSGGNIRSGDFSGIAGNLIGEGIGKLFNKLGQDNKFNQWRSGVTNNLNELYGIYNQQPQEEEEQPPKLRPYAVVDNVNNNNGYSMRNYARLLGM